MGKERTTVNIERQRQRFNREFKLEAVRLLELGQKPATQLALELGIRRNLLYKWQVQPQIGPPHRFDSKLLDREKAPVLTLKAAFSGQKTPL